MSHYMMPEKAAAIPGTNAWRRLQPSAQPALDGLTPEEGKEDEPGEEMMKDARVWKTYVREANTQDKELVDGRNRLLDILPVFAGLFATVTASFLIDSLGDLKPEPKDLATQTQQELLKTQQIMLQAVLAIANSQPLSLPSQDQASSVEFSPPRFGVIVNFFWLSSLVLSVGVSLVAMLAKDWCTWFIIGRSGSAYEQGRRRQEKWDSIQRWRLQGLIHFLLGITHLSFFLFGIGLCYYLSEINLALTTFVTVVFSCLTLGYVVATVLPTTTQHCPYSTPMTPVLRWCLNHPAPRRLFKYFWNRFSVANWIYSERVWKTIYSSILPRYVTRAERAALNNGTTHSDFASTSEVTSPEHVALSNRAVPMDVTTSRMLAWLITASLDSRSVTSALGAIAGASPGLPCSPLLLCDAHMRVELHLSRYVKQVRYNRSTFDSPDVLRATLQCIRSYATLVAEDLNLGLHTREAQATGSFFSLILRLRSVIESYKLVFYPACDILGADSKDVLLTTASCTILVAKLKELETHSNIDRSKISEDLKYNDTTTDRIMHVLKLYCSNRTAVDHVTARRFLYSVAYYFTQSDVEWCKKQGKLYGLIVRFCLASGGASTDLSRMAALVLAVAALMLRPYQGGKYSARQDWSTMSQRALQVLRYYHHEEISTDARTGAALFAFGLVAVSPYLEPDTLDMQPQIKGEILSLFFQGVWSLNRLHAIHTFPDDFDFDAHIGLSTDLLAREAVSLLQKLQSHHPDLQLYIPALFTLCFTRSRWLQGLCVKILDSQPTELDVRQVILALRFIHTPEGLSRKSGHADKYYPNVAAFYFRLLTAKIMLCDTLSLNNRQKVLESLASLNNPTQHGSPAHHDDTNNLHETLQLIDEFCKAHASPSTKSITESWRLRLEVILNEPRPKLYSVLHPSIPTDGSYNKEEPCGRDNSTRSPGQMGS